MSRLIITRPVEQAGDSIKKLEDMGHTVIHAPMVQIQRASFDVPDENTSLIITSKNGAKYGLEGVTNMRQPIYAVGEQTAKIAKDMGFYNVTTGPGTAQGLMPILQECGITIKRRYAHLCGENLAYNIARALAKHNIHCDTVITYYTRPVYDLPPEAIDAIEKKQIDGVLFYSARAAELFEERLADINQSVALYDINAYVLSSRIKDTLIAPWKNIKHAVFPSEKALFALID